MSPTMPNFFIIGAPKCGTTSLAAWLAEHPHIYMSPVKEPHHYNTDLKHLITQSKSAYRRLFNGVEAQHLAVGEASVFYLFSQVAVPAIEQECPGARYIVMVRNPVEMAYSLHEQQVFAGHEHIHDFETAWHLSPQRRAGQMTTRWCPEPRLLDYQWVCNLGEQLARLFSVVPRERVLVLTLDDMKADPRREYLKVLEFLGVPDDGRSEFPTHNPAKERRWPLLRRSVQAVIAVRRALRVPRLGLGVLRAVDKVNERSRPRSPLSAEMRAELAAYFRPDVQRLAQLLERDLSSWLHTEQTRAGGAGDKA